MFWKRNKSRDNDLDQEIRSHLDLEAEEQQANGLSPEEAGYAARRALGNATLVKESTRAAWRWRLLEQLIQDLRYGGRTLRRSPGFTTIAVLSLALGIGANTAIFTLIDALVLKSLPVSHPEELVGVTRDSVN
ncbi:MAG TPA: permease prefix domain 1-containing protein, partial [Bryobacteraceae bacterium]